METVSIRYNTISCNINGMNSWAVSAAMQYSMLVCSAIGIQSIPYCSFAEPIAYSVADLGAKGLFSPVPDRLHTMQELGRGREAILAVTVGGQWR